MSVLPLVHRLALVAASESPCSQTADTDFSDKSSPFVYRSSRSSLSLPLLRVSSLKSRERLEMVESFLRFWSAHVARSRLFYDFTCKTRTDVRSIAFAAYLSFFDSIFSSGLLAGSPCLVPTVAFERHVEPFLTIE